jgi:16S rRNA C1402 N4-methylase RsmH
MVASHTTVEQIIKIILKYIDIKTARRMARDLYCHVNGNKSTMDTFRRLSEILEDME